MSKYFDNLVNRMYYEEDGSFYVYIGGRNNGKTIFTTCRFLEFLFGGTCEYQYDPHLQVHHYLIKNDDIGFIDMTVTNECFKNENLNVRIYRICEEYDGCMRYKYRDYMCREQILNSIDKYIVERK